MGSLAVVQQWIGADPPAFVELSMCRNLEWAQRHGYEFQFHRDAHATNASWSASWERVPLMLDLLRRGRTVLWVDTDLQVIDPPRTIESILCADADGGEGGDGGAATACANKASATRTMTTAQRRRVFSVSVNCPLNDPLPLNFDVTNGEFLNESSRSNCEVLLNESSSLAIAKSRRRSTRSQTRRTWRTTAVNAV